MTARKIVIQGCGECPRSDHGAHAIDADDVRELLATAHHDCPDCGGSGIVGTLPADGGAAHYEPCTRCGGLGGIGVRRPARRAARTAAEPERSQHDRPERLD